MIIRDFREGFMPRLPVGAIPVILTALRALVQLRRSLRWSKLQVSGPAPTLLPQPLPLLPLPLPLPPQKSSSDA